MNDRELYDNAVAEVASATVELNEVYALVTDLRAAFEAKDGEVARLREAWHRSFTMLRATYPHPDHVPLVVERVIDMMDAALAPSTPKEGG